MSEAILSASDCCQPCDDSLVTEIPGSPGADGAAGADGSNGENSYTTLTNPFTMPAEGFSGTADVGNSDWMAVGQKVFVGQPGGGARGTLEVVDKVDSVSVELLNVENTGNGEYTDNSPAGTVFASASVVSPSGLQGPGGSVPGGVLLSANNLADVTSVPASRANLGLGTAAVLIAGNANGNLPLVNDGAGLTNGEFIRATASGVESVDAATARTGLGLGTIATQNANAVAITGGTITGVVIDGSGGDFETDNLTVDGKLYLPSSALQSLLNGSTVNPNASRISVVGNGGPVSLASTPTVIDGDADGQYLLITGTDNTNTVTFNADSSLPGTKLHLGAASRALGEGDILELLWDDTLGGWYEVGFTNNN
jgi:hypothetical protein